MRAEGEVEAFYSEEAGRFGCTAAGDAAGRQRRRQSRVSARAALVGVTPVFPGLCGS